VTAAVGLAIDDELANVEATDVKFIHRQGAHMTSFERERPARALFSFGFVRSSP